MSSSRVLSLGRDLTAARTARAFVRESVAGQVDDSVLDDALLVASELVTNAVMHAGTRSSLEVRVDGGRLELRVSDGSRRTPRPRTLVGGPAEQGRGLVLLQALARSWGVEESADGKTVWAVLG